MPYTRLSITATPGRNYSFSAKDLWDPDTPRPADILFTNISVTATPGRRYNFSPRGKVSKRFTELSIQAIPGRIHSFIAKDPATPPPGRPPGEFTALQLYAVPGKRKLFLAKTEAEIIAVSTAEEIMGPPDQDFRFYNRVIREDDEILTFILNAVTSGILDS